MAARRGGVVGRLLQEVEERTGSALVPRDQLDILEEGYSDARVMQRELDLIGYTVLDYLGSNPVETKPEARKNMAKKVLIAWIHDPQLARSIELLNDFTFGRGVPQPRAKDKKVQEILDNFWSDPDNKAVLTSHEAQTAIGTDLSIQSNLFFLIFDNGKDGKIKLSLLAHDTVDDVVRDEENRFRILYYMAKEQKQRFDFTRDQYVSNPGDLAKKKVLYYPHYANIDAAAEDDRQIPAPPKEKLGDGKVYHIAVNRTSEMAFGIPSYQRVIRWASAYNDLMAARVDMVKAAAAFIMKRQVKGTPNQLAKMATRAISRQSPLAGVDQSLYPQGGRAAGIINENDMVTHSAFKLDTGSAQAAQDGDLLHGQIAAGTGFPKHYLGNSDANLATATAMELFVIKLVEARQELFTGLIRTLCDMVIQKAIDDGKLDTTADEEDDNDQIERDEVDAYSQIAAAAMVEAGMIEESAQDEASEKIRARLLTEIEDEAAQERQTDRDLTYEFSMPSPLRRQMTDLVTSIQSIAQTFDPNNTNTELSRVLLAIALGEGLEVDDPADLVSKIFPEGYVDPILAAAQQGAAPGADGTLPRGPSNMFGPTGNNNDSGSDGTGYGAPMRATSPENVPGAAVEARFVAVRGRDGRNLWQMVEARAVRPDEDEALVTQARGSSAELDVLFDNIVGRAALSELKDLTVGANVNGHGSDD